MTGPASGMKNPASAIFKVSPLEAFGGPGLIRSNLLKKISQLNKN